MKYFLSIRYNDYVGGCDLISLGLVCEDGRKFYAETKEYSNEGMSPWTMDNVVKQLLYRNQTGYNLVNREEGNVEVYGNRASIRYEVLDFIGNDKYPMFYTYRGAYDWFLFTQLYKRLVDVPSHFLSYYQDLRWMMKERELDDVWLNATCPPPNDQAVAIKTAMWCKELYEALIYHVNNYQL